jgi:hypothetical protein
LELQRRGRSFEAVAILLRLKLEKSGLKVDRSTVKKLEGGQVPSWPLLLALADVYGVSVKETTGHLVGALEFAGASDLIRHDPTVELAPHLGGADAAATRVRELERQLEERDARLSEAEDVARRLMRIFTTDAESAAARTTKRKGGGGDRKAG